MYDIKDEFHESQKNIDTKKDCRNPKCKKIEDNKQAVHKKKNFYFLWRYLPKNCEKGGYVHMFPTFYKHCVIFDMDLYEKDWFE
jgi:hypothetical protein